MAVKVKPITILLLEDNPGDARLLREYLREETPDQYQIKHSKKLNTGLNRLAKEKPDIILLDLDLPDCQGLDTFTQLQTEAPDVPIVILTGLSDSDQAIKAVQAGAQDYLVKGEVNNELLVRAIQYAIERKQAETALRESEERFRGIFENTTIGIYRTSTDGRILLANPAIIQMLGYDSFEELAQRNLEQSGFEPEYPRNEFRDLIEKDGAVQGLEAAWTKKDGSTIFIRESAIVVRDAAGKIAYYEGTVEDITKRKRVEKTVLHQAEEMDTLQQIVLDITSPHKLPDLLQTIVERAAHLLNADGGGLYLCDPELQEARNVVSFKTKRDYTGIVLKYGEGAAGVVAKTGEPLLIDDYRTWPNRAKVYEKEQPFRAVVCVPMLWHSQVTGVIHVLRNGKNNPFTQADMDLLNIFANHAAVATENAKLLENLSESEEKHRLVLDNVDELIYQVTIDRENLLTSKLDFVSKQSQTISGYTPEEFLNEASLWFKLIHPDDLAQVQAQTEKLLADKENVTREFRLRHKVAGQYRWLEDRVSPQLDSSGNLIGMFGVARDITNRKIAERALLESEEKYRTLFEDMPVGVYRTTREGKHLAVNQALVDILGYDSIEDIMTTDVYANYANPKIRDGLVKDTLEQGEIKNVETTQICKDGREIIVLDTSHAVYGKQGKFLHFEGTITDITAWRRAEKQVKESEEKYRTLFENVPTGVYRTTPDGKFIEANPALVELFGCKSEDELLNTKVTDSYVNKADRKKWISDLSKSDELHNTELRLKCKDGREIIGLDNSSAVRDENGNILYFEGTLTDITAIKRAERALRDRNDELDRLYHASDSLILSSTLDLHSLSQIIVETILNEFEQSNCSLLLVEEHFPELHRIAVAGPYSAQVASKTLDLDGKGLAPEAIRRGQLINEGDVLTRKEYVPNWEAARSELVIPLIVSEKVIGVIDVQSATANAFNSDNERLMMVFAKQVAMALERARLFEAEQRRATRLNALQDLTNELATLHSEQKVLHTLVTRGATLANSPTCSVMLLDIHAGEARLVAQTGLPDKTSRGLRVPLQIPIIKNAIETGEPIIISDIDRDAPTFRSILVHPNINAFYAFPILNEDTVIGFITLSSLLPRSLSEAEKTTYELLAKLASVTLHNVRLFEHTSRNLERLASLRTVDIAIATSFDLSVTIDVLLQQVTDKLKVDAASLLLHDPEEHSLKFARNRGFRTQALRYTSLRVGEGHAGRVALERRTINIPDLKRETRELKQSPDFYDEGFVSYIGFPLIAKGQIKGVLEVFNRTPLNPDQEWLDFINAIADQAAIAIDNAELFQNLQQSNAELSLAYDNTLEGWANALELRDEETEGHTRRVTELTVKLAIFMGLRKSNFVHIRRGALLHDVGKMGIPDEILLKPGPLSEEEWVIMRKHPEYAYNWLSRINYLRPALDIPYSHHEKWDGSGYPRALKGEQIPIAARIFAVIDVWDALCSDRPYRKAWTGDEALNYIREQSGAHFDPTIVDAFLKRIIGIEE